MGKPAKKKKVSAKKAATIAAKKRAALAAKEKADEVANLELVGWITAKEASELLRLTPRRVRDFLLSGRLPAMRVGRTWFIKREDVLNFSLIKRKPGRPVQNEKEPPVFAS